MGDNEVRRLLGAKPGIFYGYVIVVASFLIMVIMWGASYSFGVFFSRLLEEFGWTRAMTSGAFSLSLVVLSFSGLVSGRLTDRFGPRIVVTLCGLFLGAGYFLMSQVNAIWQLYLFYGVLIGIGMSTAFVPLVSTVAKWFARRRGIMTGIAASGLSMGTLVMPPIANWLISLYGWRTSYMIIGGLALVTVLIGQLLKRDPAEVGLLPYGAANPEESLGVVATGFSLQKAIATRQLWMLGGAALCFTMGLGTTIVHIVPHSIGLGVSPAPAAAILAFIGGAGTVGRVTMGSAADRTSNKLALLVCFVLLAISLFYLVIADKLWMIYLFAVIFGFAYGGISALLSPTIAELYGLSSHGAILAIVNVCGEGGLAIGSVVAGYIFDVTGGYTSAFLLSAIFAVIGLALVAFLTPPVRATYHQPT